MLNDDIVIRVDGLGKRYLVPQKHEATHAHAPTWKERLKEFFPALLGADESDFFWALRDVSFEVRRGEVLGIVGENGSGKSTLLKILSGVTPPTEGRAELRGRVGSLLEVGTGFHPDLTGRENIFFNGSLLGIQNAEIRAKLDSIVAFSGIADFIDVPVKRYSSGMYVRLAYSVAALLESDILILDEVLAVGDDAFRQKTQEHMRQTTRGAGKTILFVSHNPRSVSEICDRAIILYKGRVVFEGSAKEVLAEYQSRDYLQSGAGGAAGASGAAHTSRHYQPRAFADVSALRRMRYSGMPDPTSVLKWVSVHRMDGEPCARFRTFEGMRVRIGFSGIDDPANRYFSVLLHNSRGERVLTADSMVSGRNMDVKESGVVECVVPTLQLGDGIYNVMIDTGVYYFDINKLITRECVPFATYIQVSTDGQLKGKGIDETEGAVHLSNWRLLDDPKGAEARQLPATLEPVRAAAKAT
jgi:lipopolysaccharide transport system ATP-binding protein